MAYYGIDPFGEERADWRAGIVASTVANTARDPKQQREPFTPEEFMPKFATDESPEQTPEQMLAIVEMLNAAFGGQDLRPK